MNKKKIIKFNASQLPTDITITGFESKYQQHVQEIEEQQENTYTGLTISLIFNLIGVIILVFGVLLLCFAPQKIYLNRLLSPSILQILQTNAIILCIIGIVVLVINYLFTPKSAKQLSEIQFLQKHYDLCVENGCKDRIVKVLKYNGDNHFTVTLK